jgi:ribosomal protein L14
MRRILAVAAAIAVMAFVSIGAVAGNCSSAIVVFTRTQVQRDAGVGAVNPNAVVCAEPSAGDAAPADTRVLVPLAAEISIRYTRDLGASAGQLTAIVNGLGFANASMTLPRVVDSTTGLASYAGSFVRIPQGEMASGAITVRITHPAIPGTDSVCFHTWNAAC